MLKKLYLEENVYCRQYQYRPGEFFVCIKHVQEKQYRIGSIIKEDLDMYIGAK